MTRGAAHPPSPGPAWPTLAAGAVLAAGTCAVYAQTLTVPLLFDDRAWLLENPALRHVGELLALPAQAVVGGRPLLNLSYALNYAAGGIHVLGYHLVNLLIHLCAAWTLFALVRRTLRTPRLAARFGSAATALALAISALWAWHPLQTEAVTYLAQRAESLMGLCYLLTLYCFVRGCEAALPGSRERWFALSVLACLAGVGTKEVIVTAPLLVLLYDRTFLSSGFAGAWRRHWPVYAALAATWLPLGWLMTGLGQRGVGFGHGATATTYGLAECRVVVKYLLLAFWPKPLVFDYGLFVPPFLSETWPYAVVLALLLGLTALALWRAPAAGFAACWFFLILAPTSSIVPLVAQPMAESRLYLPLAGVVALAVLALHAKIGRASLAVCAVLALALGTAAVARNQDYRSELALWRDTVAKVPGNARAHNNLANIWAKLPGRMSDAIAESQAALRLEPGYADAHNNLGFALEQQGRAPEALAQYAEALRLDPNLAEAHSNLGDMWYATPGRMSDAIAEYRRAILLKPALPEAHNNLGNAWLATPGRMSDAIAEYEKALELNPDFAAAHNDLGSAWLRQSGRLEQAIAQYREALRLQPDYVDAHFNLGLALARLPGHDREAREQLEMVLRLRPEDQQARQILAKLPPAGP